MYPCKSSQSSSPDESTPFCSGRCKMVDLSRWLDGSYRIGVDVGGSERTEPMSEELALAEARTAEVDEEWVH